jgi:hypothetical protein
MNESNPLDAPDLPPLDGENPDIREWARETIGEWWLNQPNISLSGRTPEQTIQDGHGARVRDIIRRVLYIGVT